MKINTQTCCKISRRKKPHQRLSLRGFLSSTSPTSCVTASGLKSSIIHACNFVEWLDNGSLAGPPNPPLASLGSSSCLLLLMQLYRSLRSSSRLTPGNSRISVVRLLNNHPTKTNLLSSPPSLPTDPHTTIFLHKQHIASLATKSYHRL
jgi:hypothetical protein